MPDIELVIKIPGEIRKAIYDGVYCGISDKRVYDAIKNGVTLPKGHDYIDRNNAITSICQHYTTCERMKMLSFTPNLIKQEVTDILCAEPTIIEVDNAGGEE